MPQDPIISQLFRASCSGDFGIRPAHAIEVVRAPDHTSEFRWLGFEIDLHAKRIDQAHPPCWLLILERLDGGRRQVEFGLRVYDDVAGDVANVTPWRLLQAVVERFGLPVRVGEQEAKLITTSSIPVKSAQDIPLLTGQARPGVSFVAQMLVTLDQGPPLVAHCALCFCLNTAEYVAYLRPRRR